MGQRIKNHQIRNKKESNPRDQLVPGKSGGNCSERLDDKDKRYGNGSREIAFHLCSRTPQNKSFSDRFYEVIREQQKVDVESQENGCDSFTRLYICKQTQYFCR
jgi:hypothetical protein